MRTVRRTASLLAAVVLVGAAACGTDDASTGDNGTPSEPGTTVDRAAVSADGSWVLVAGTLDGEPLDLVDGRDVTLVIDGSEIGGTAACNGYGGSVTLGEESEFGGSFAVGELAWTEMACEPAVMELEQRFLAAVQKVDSYELADTLSHGDGFTAEVDGRRLTVTATGGEGLSFVAA